MKRSIPEWCKTAKTAMIQQDLSIGDLAEGLGYTRQYISAILNGRVFSPMAIRKVSEYLKIPDQVERTPQDSL